MNAAELSKAGNHADSAVGLAVEATPKPSPAPRVPVDSAAAAAASEEDTKASTGLLVAAAAFVVASAAAVVVAVSEAEAATLEVLLEEVRGTASDHPAELHQGLEVSTGEEVTEEVTEEATVEAIVEVTVEAIGVMAVGMIHAVADAHMMTDRVVATETVPAMAAVMADAMVLAMVLAMVDVTAVVMVAVTAVATVAREATWSRSAAEKVGIGIATATGHHVRTTANEASRVVVTTIPESSVGIKPHQCVPWLVASPPTHALRHPPLHSH